MRYFLLFTLIILTGINSKGQLILLDKETDEPIVFAHITSKNGTLLAYSDLDGKANITLDSISNDETYVFQHIVYENYSVKGKELLCVDTILMQKKMVTLPEVVVSDNRTVTVLKAYFRCYELNDSIPKYFTDGIAQYYIDSRGKVKMKLLEYRSFQNTELVLSENQRANMIIMNLANIPRLDEKSIIETLKKNKYQINNVELNKQDITQNELKVGTIRQDPVEQILELSFDFIIPKPYVERSLFNYISQIHENKSIEIYSGMELSTLTSKDLLRRKDYREIFFKHKKDSKFIQLQGYNELYIYMKKIILIEMNLKS